jgi:hypothetical protein
MSIARWCNIIIVEASGHDVVCQSCFVNTCAVAVVAVACCCCCCCYCLLLLLAAAARLLRLATA